MLQQKEVHVWSEDFVSLKINGESIPIEAFQIKLLYLNGSILNCSYGRQ